MNPKGDLSLSRIKPAFEVNSSQGRTVRSHPASLSLEKLGNRRGCSECLNWSAFSTDLGHLQRRRWAFSLHRLVGGQQNSPFRAYLHSLIAGTNSFLTRGKRVKPSPESYALRKITSSLSFIELAEHHVWQLPYITSFKTKHHSFIKVMWFHVSDDSAGGKRQGFYRSAEEGSGLELVWSLSKGLRLKWK